MAYNNCNCNYAFKLQYTIMIAQLQLIAIAINCVLTLGRQIVNFLGWDILQEELDRACEMSTFELIHKNEKVHLYNSEKSIIRRNSLFIRERMVGASQIRLTEEMEERLLDKMKDSGLLDDSIDWLLNIPTDQDLAN